MEGKRVVQLAFFSFLALFYWFLLNFKDFRAHRNFFPKAIAIFAVLFYRQNFTTKSQSTVDLRTDVLSGSGNYFL